ncbi:MAG TPA: FAD-dependent thymidylate synthase, partial [Planctomycetota bacterium]|nr:FAD-dependent thymidylate synthase [Planctomycetota bacterium]
LAAGGAIAGAYEQVLASTFALYGELSSQLLERLQQQRPLQPGEKEAPWLRTLKAEAFDAARYLLTPAIYTKWGMVADARTLSEVITELLSHPLAEFRIVGERIKQQAETVLPSLLAHARPNPFLQAQHATLPRLAAGLGLGPLTVQHGPQPSRTELLASDQELDHRLLASLLYERSAQPFSALVQAVKGLTAGQRRELLAQAMAGRGSHDPWPIGLEGAAPFEFEVLLDFGAYRDIGRHRKGFQQQQPLTTDHGFLVPPLLVEAGLAGRYTAVLEHAAGLQRTVAAALPQAAGYVTPFAFLQRVRIAFEPRQLAYFIELRSGPEGHFAYRKIALDMLAQVRAVSPLFAEFIRASEGAAFLGRMLAEQTADERRLARMKAAGDG